MVARVVIVDGQLLYREGMLQIMNQWPEFRVVGEASTGADAVALCGQHKPDIVLVDVQTPLSVDVDIVSRLREASPRSKVVVLTVCVDADVVFRAIENGVSGYLLKDIPSSKLREYLQSVVQGESVLAQPLVGSVFNEFNRRRPYSARQKMESSCKLSELGTEILRLVAQGYSNDEISEQLYISTGTVKKHLGILMQDLHFKNRVQLAAFAIRSGMAD